VEFNVVTGAFASNYPGITSGQKTFRYGDYKYVFQINDFGDYVIKRRTAVSDADKKEKIKKGE